MSAWNIVNATGEPDVELLLVTSFSNDFYEVSFLTLNDGVPSGSRGWSQHCTLDDFKVFVNVYNPALEASTVVLFNRLKYSTTEPSANSTTFQLTGQSSDSHRTLSLSCPLSASIHYQWRFECDLMNSEEFGKVFFVPVIKLASFLKHQNEMLRKIIIRKDREIDEHRENGSKIKRGHLETEPFDVEKFVTDSKKDAVRSNAVAHPVTTLLAGGHKNECSEAISWLEKPDVTLSPIKSSPVKITLSTGSKEGKISIQEAKENNSIDEEREAEEREKQRRLELESLRQSSAANPRKRKQKSVF